MRYRVSGSREVLGHKAGEEFDAELDAVTEARLYAGGHIERLDVYSFDPGSGADDGSDPNGSDVIS